MHKLEETFGSRRLETDVTTLNEIVAHMKKMNREALRSKVKSDSDLPTYDELKVRYVERSRELDEAARKIDHLKKLCKVLEEKLGQLFSVHGENRKLRKRTSRLLKRFESTCKENRAYLNELSVVKTILSSVTKRDENVTKIVELQRSLRDKETEYKESLDKIRNDAKRSLLTLESKIVTKIKNECTEGGFTLPEEVQKKLLHNECMIQALNTSNLHLKERLELKENQYNELENNYLRLKVNSRQSKHDFKSYGKTDPSYKKLMEKNIKEALIEVIETKSNKSKQLNQRIERKEPERLNTVEELGNFLLLHDTDSKKSNQTQDYHDFIEELFRENRTDRERNSTDLTDDSSGTADELLSTDDVDFEELPRSFKIDIKENEISVEVKRCTSSDSHKTIK